MIHSHNFSVRFYLHMNYDTVSKYNNIDLFSTWNWTSLYLLVYSAVSPEKDYRMSWKLMISMGPRNKCTVGLIAVIKLLLFTSCLQKGGQVCGLFLKNCHLHLKTYFRWHFLFKILDWKYLYTLEFILTIEILYLKCW